MINIIIIGAGGAGCSAAIEASQYTKNILILTKGDARDSKTQKAQGGIQAALSEDDSIKSHFEDTMKVGNYKNNDALARILTSKAPETIKWLEEIGVEFDKKENNQYQLKKAAGTSFARVVSCGDSTGNKIVSPLLDRLKKLSITLKENALVKKITKKQNHFDILVSFNGDERIIHAKSVIIATGGLLPKEKRAGLSTTDHDYAPDGIELAKGLGVVVKQANMVQYHPTGVILPKSLRRERLPETMRACGATFLDKDLNEVADPLMSRNKLTKEIITLCESGRCVITDDGRKGLWLNTPKIDAKMGDGYTQINYPKIYKSFMKCNHNITKKPVLIYPILHYSLGGISINEYCETNIKGVFSAGETSYGVHGEDRLMGNSLLDIFVFGRISGVSAAKFSLGVDNKL